MKMTFEIKKVKYQNEENYFTIMAVKVKNAEKAYLKNSEQTVMGIMKSVYVGDVYEAELKEKHNSTFGKGYELVGRPVLAIPTVDKAIMDFIIRRTKDVKGFGKKKVEAIVEKFGLETLEIIRKTPEKLEECGIKEEKAKQVQNAINGHREFDEVLELLVGFGIHPSTATFATEAIEGLSKAKIIANPYILANSEKIDFKTCDTIAKQLDKDPDNRDRKRTAVIEYMTKRNQNNGDICVLEDDVIETFADGEFLEVYGAYQNAIYIDSYEVVELLEALKKDGVIASDYSENDDNYIYLKAFLHIETEIARNIADINDMDGQTLVNRAEVEAFVNQYEQNGFKLAKNQREAVQMVASNKLSILNGGPGTGKTATTDVIVKMVENVKPNATIRILAPTGKASKRISEVTGREATTIHRALGIKGFGNDADEVELTDDFIIVDESSMIDAQLFYKLLKNTSKESRILLVGDPNQLDSVGAGRILSDLIESGCVACTTLTEVFRQASTSQIVSNAHKIIEGKDFTTGLTAEPQKGDFYFVERQSAKQTLETLIQSVDRFIQMGNKIEDIMVLSPMRKGELGTDNLNRMMQMQFNPPTHYIDYEKNDGQFLRVGDRVIHTENNPELGVFNGEIGTIESIVEKVHGGRKRQTIEVKFPDREEAIDYTGGNIEQLTLAYCITIHKSQGSEAKIVMMPVHQSQAVMLDRSLLYTGITRAKQTVILLGSKEAFNTGVAQVKSSKRTSLLQDRLNEMGA